VKLAAGAWREIEHAGLTATAGVRALVQQLLDSTVEARVVGRGDGEHALRAFAAGTTPAAATTSAAAGSGSGSGPGAISGPTRFGDPRVRPATALGRGL
ncbi:hypothetical protein JCM21900_005934, partial [Sporobolomyces salmonicolor]